MIVIEDLSSKFYVSIGKFKITAGSISNINVWSGFCRTIVKSIGGFFLIVCLALSEVFFQYQVFLVLFGKLAVIY